VRFHQTGTKRLHHPVVGELILSYETMELSADSGLTMTIYTAEPGSASQNSLDILASWSATLDQPDIAGVGDDANSR
jgi:MmyB-like transcription regulator ligand binding domain